MTTPGRVAQTQSTRRRPAPGGITAALATLIVLGEWTGLARGLLGAPYYAAILDLGLVVIVAVAAAVAWREDRLPDPHPLDLLLLGFALLALVQVLNPNVPSLVVGLEGFRKTAFTVFGYAVIRLSGCRDPRPFYVIVALGSIPALLWAIRQAFVPLPIDLAIISTAGASPISFHAGIAMRAFAPTAGPFHLGILAGTVLIVAVVFSQRAGRWFLLSMLAGAALGLSITRANIGATAGALVVMAIIQATTRERIKLVLTGAPAVALALALGFAAATLPAMSVTPPSQPPPSGSAGAGSGTGTGSGAGAVASAEPAVELPSLEEDRSFQFRLLFWREQLEAIVERPLLGYGTSAAADGFDDVYAGTDSRHFGPHSLYTKPALELGVLGFVLFATILVGVFVSILRIVQANRLLATLSMGLFMLVTVAGLTGPMLDAYPFNVLFWATVAWVVVWQPPRSPTVERNVSTAAADEAT